MTKKFAETLMTLTRVVDDARVRADVKSAHMAMLKMMLRPKNVARRRKLT